MKLSPREMKRQARETLTGNYFAAVNLTISLTLFTFLLTLLTQNLAVTAPYQKGGMVLYWILYVIILLLNALLETGLIRFLYLLCKKEALRQPGLLFYALRNQPDSFILTYAFRYLVSLVWFVPALWLYAHLPVITDLGNIPADFGRQLGLILLLAAAALIPAVLLALPWCLSTYVLLDDPNCPPAEALRTSRRLMRGQCVRVLRIWLGFLPLGLLGIGSMGIGFLWIRPYFHTVMGRVYLGVKGEA